MNLKNKYLKLTKVSDDAFNGDHPNGINVGNTKIQGYNKQGIVKGEQLFLFPSLKWESSPYAWTSIVKSFNEKTLVLKTKNSTYQIEVIENEED